MIKYLLNPFDKFSDKTLITASAWSTIIGVFLGFVCNARFDGIIDLHFGANISLLESLLFVFFDITILVILLFALAKLINNKSRLLDLLIAVLLARTPIYLLSIANIGNKMFDMGVIINQKISNGQIFDISISMQFILVAMSIISFLAIIWFCILLFNGFKTATNIKQKKHILYFIAIVLIAEIVSKILISYII